MEKVESIVYWKKARYIEEVPRNIWGKTRDELEKAHQYVSKMFDRCLDVAVLSKMLYGHEIEIGSCGFVQDKSKTIYQEFGNFREEPDY